MEDYFTRLQKEANDNRKSLALGGANLHLSLDKSGGESPEDEEAVDSVYSLPEGVEKQRLSPNARRTDVSMRPLSEDNIPFSDSVSRRSKKRSMAQAGLLPLSLNRRVDTKKWKK